MKEHIKIYIAVFVALSVSILFFGLSITDLKTKNSAPANVSTVDNFDTPNSY